MLEIIIYENYQYVNSPYGHNFQINNYTLCFIRNAFQMKSVCIQIAWHEGVRNLFDVIVRNATFVLLINLTINHKSPNKQEMKCFNWMSIQDDSILWNDA